MIIYKVTNKINGKIYIGQTKHSIEKRMKQHISGHCGRYFYSAIKKYGYLNFIFEIIDSCDNFEDLDKKEQYYIKLYNSDNKDKGYNMTSGGQLGMKYNKESRENLGKSRKGIVMSLETRQKISKAKKGHKQSIETIKKRIASHSGSKHYRYGKHCSDELKEKLSKFNMGKKLSEETKKRIGEACNLRKYIYNIIDPNGVRYDNIKALGVFFKEHNLKYNLVHRAFFDRHQKSYKGWCIERIAI
jgi:group I intron endonuclease